MAGDPPGYGNAGAVNCKKFGFIGYGKTRQNPGNDRIAADSEQWLITVGRHKEIIPGEEFAKAQKILSENADSKIKFKQSHNPSALLSGILFCSCGSYMRPKYYRENKNGVKPYAYMCELKELSKSERCRCQNVNGAYADKAVCDILLNYEADDNIFHKYLSGIKRGDVTGKIDSAIKEQENIKSELREKIQNLVDTISRGVDDVTLEYINGEIVKLNAQIKAADDEIGRLQVSLEGAKDSEKIFNSTQNALKFFKENFDTLSTENKRNYIRACISRITWDGEKLHIFTRG